MRADTAKGGASEGSATGEAAKPATKKTRKKKTTGGVEDRDKPTRFSWLEASSEAFLDFLKLLIIAGKETNGASFKATDYADAIPYIKSKSGQDLTVEQLSNKYDYWKATWREWEAHSKACSGWGRHEVTGLPWTDEPGVMDNYFNKHVKRRPFRKKWPPHYEQLRDLLEGKMACGDHAASIDDALDENSAWNNREEDDTDSVNEDSEGEDEENYSEDPNTPRGTIERSPSSTSVDDWSPTPLPASAGASIPSTPSPSSRSSSVSSSSSQSPSPVLAVVEKKARKTQKAKNLDLVKRSTKNAAIAANRSRLSKSAVTEALSASISQATETFDSLKATLLAMHVSPIEKAVGSFVREFHDIPAADQQLVLKAFETESKAYIFNSLTGELRKGWIEALLVDMRPQQRPVVGFGLVDGGLELNEALSSQLDVEFSSGGYEE